MGNESSSSSSSNSNSLQPHQSPIESLIDSSFQAIKSQQITRSQFNQALKIFQAINYISICNSHLASRLFEIMEPDNKGRLDKNLVADKLKKFVKDPSKAGRYSFRLYDSDGNGKISRREFSDFLQKSWATQIEIVKQKLKSQPNFNAEAFYEWLKSRKEEILQISGQIFSMIDSQNRNNILYEEFEMWINSGNYDMIVFKFADTSMKFPLHIGAIITSN